MISTDNGNNWSTKQPLVNSNLNEEKPMFYRSKDGRIFVFYNVSKPTPFSNIKQYDIHYSVSEDEGLIWTHHQLTRYVGDDQIVSITDSENNPLVLILTKRYSPILKNQLGIGVVGLVKDIIAPPVIFKTEITKSTPKDPIYFKS